jgi:hypothetical protein
LRLACAITFLFSPTADIRIPSGTSRRNNRASVTVIVTVTVTVTITIRPIYSIHRRRLDTTHAGPEYLPSTGNDTITTTITITITTPTTVPSLSQTPPRPVRRRRAQHRRPLLQKTPPAPLPNHVPAVSAVLPAGHAHLEPRVGGRRGQAVLEAGGHYECAAHHGRESPRPLSCPE